MDKKDLKTVMWSTIEDYCVIWELRSRHKNYNASQLKKIALEIIEYLVDGAFIELFFCKEPYGETVKITDTASYYTLIKNDTYWQVPNTGMQSIRITATKKGEKLYHNMDWNDQKPR